MQQAGLWQNTLVIFASDNVTLPPPPPPPPRPHSESRTTSPSALRMKLQIPCFRCSSLSTLDTGSGREIPAICHGTGVCTCCFYPRILGMGRFQVAVAFLAWVSQYGQSAPPEGLRSAYLLTAPPGPCRRAGPSTTPRSESRASRHNHNTTAETWVDRPFHVCLFARSYPLRGGKRESATAHHHRPG